MQEQLKEIEQLANILRLTKEYLNRLKLSDKELAKYKKQIELPDKYPVYGVDTSKLRIWAREIYKLYRTADFAKFFKLFEALWENEHNSLEERYIAMILLQQRRKDLGEPDVCLDTWAWLWREKNLKYIQNFSLVEHIANTVTYQIMEAWFEIREAEDIIWKDLKEHAFSPSNNKWEQCLAILTPFRKLNEKPEWVLPTLEVVTYALRSTDVDVHRAIELVFRESAKSHPDLIFEFIKRFINKSPAIVPDNLKFVSRYLSDEQKKEINLV